MKNALFIMEMGLKCVDGKGHSDLYRGIYQMQNGPFEKGKGLI